ncbi:hypothetical protein [Micromonospora schwarzwaldensis]|uniref:hypothetical protein n=1 Tax=Micromonospora sp. DSM 45708 TaxID=3111767 RepID=UPI0031E01C8A
MCVVLTAGCGLVGSGGSAGPGAAGNRYGYAPKPGRSVVYQPDVVLVSGGGDVICGPRSATVAVREPLATCGAKAGEASLSSTGVSVSRSSRVILMFGY